ncbi:arginine biosynthesis ArgJ [Histoplasma capsulatum var. duboisii H88]|uniref:Arginine biosynthesis ArgJ n=1 Tax=Ajellomyces capsulatus (strain H88) TaxID=544711 RepID=A0A8A1LRF6_AJEC8|nr:arginine biosynthesis ArgJ [Histoplasma capsulatum var. duboisii H88]
MSHSGKGIQEPVSQLDRLAVFRLFSSVRASIEGSGCRNPHTSCACVLRSVIVTIGEFQGAY